MIEVKGLRVSLGEFRLKDVALSIDEGDFFVLMGPTGAGKTVFMEAIAGLVPVLGGSIAIGGTDMTRLPPERRGVGIMYQDYALFPHLTVARNITYGLRYRRHDRNPPGSASASSSTTSASATCSTGARKP
jgi:molybdate/tungstate transport system ATP-binding protein